MSSRAGRISKDFEPDKIAGYIYKNRMYDEPPKRKKLVYYTKDDDGYFYAQYKSCKSGWFAVLVGILLVCTVILYKICNIPHDLYVNIPQVISIDENDILHCDINYSSDWNVDKRDLLLSMTIGSTVLFEEEVLEYGSSLTNIHVGILELPASNGIYKAVVTIKRVGDKKSYTYRNTLVEIGEYER